MGAGRQSVGDVRKRLDPAACCCPGDDGAALKTYGCASWGGVGPATMAGMLGLDLVIACRFLDAVVSDTHPTPVSGAGHPRPWWGYFL
jgi:hypothetical protein